MWSLESVPADVGRLWGELKQCDHIRHLSWFEQCFPRWTLLPHRCLRGHSLSRWMHTLGCQAQHCSAQRQWGSPLLLVFLSIWIKAAQILCCQRISRTAGSLLALHFCSVTVCCSKDAVVLFFFSFFLIRVPVPLVLNIQPCRKWLEGVAWLLKQPGHN